jgi:hypothetical protein
MMPVTDQSAAGDSRDYPDKLTDKALLRVETRIAGRDSLLCAQLPVEAAVVILGPPATLWAARFGFPLWAAALIVLGQLVTAVLLRLTRCPAPRAPGPSRNRP